MGEMWKSVIVEAAPSATRRAFLAGVVAIFASACADPAGREDAELDVDTGGAEAEVSDDVPEPLDSDAGETATDDVDVELDVDSAGEPEVGSGPVVAFTSPLEGEVVSGEQIALTVAVTGASPIEAVEFLVEGSGLGVDSEAPWEAMWDPSGLEPDVYTLSAVATDAEARRGSASIEVRYAGWCAPPRDCPPTVAFASLENGEGVDGVVEVELDVWDDVGVERVELLIDGVTQGVDTDAPYAVTWDASRWEEDYYSLVAQAVDTDGNVGEAEVRIAVNRMPPMVEILAPLGGTYDDVMEYEVEARDFFPISRLEWYDASGEFTVEVDEQGRVIELDGTPFAVVEPFFFTGTLDTAGVGRGERELAVVAWDEPGLAGVGFTSAYFDRPPLIELVSPEPGTVITGPFVLRVRVEDEPGSDVSAAVFVNGNRRRLVTGAATHDLTVSVNPPFEVGSVDVRVEATEVLGQSTVLSHAFELYRPFDLAVQACGSPCGPLSDLSAADGTVRLAVSTAGSEGETYTVRIFVNGELRASSDEVPFSWNWNSWSDDDGETDVRVVVVDGSGHTMEVVGTVIVNNCDRDLDGYPARTCGGTDCDDRDRSTTDNGCGGCDPLAPSPGRPCGTCGLGTVVCDGTSATVCTGDPGADGRNDCGGCETLDGAPGDACVVCGIETELACSPWGDGLVCGLDARNACGGCGQLDESPGDSCGPCGLDVWLCDEDGESVVCSGETRNVCGGCGDYSREVGDPCSDCDEEPCTTACGVDGTWKCDRVEGFSLVPAGSFNTYMCHTWSDYCPSPNRVTLTRDFIIGTTEVTQGQWKDVMGSSPSFATDCGDDCPVERVSWWDALAYANALSLREGYEPCYELVGCSSVGTGCSGNLASCTSASCSSVTVTAPGENPYLCDGYRLPTEAEWEYAGRAGSEFDTWVGDVQGPNCDVPVLEPVAWYCGTSGGTVHPVGQKLPNAFGLFDVHGNVNEWVWDRAGSRLEESTDPYRSHPSPSRCYVHGGHFESAAAPTSFWRRYDLQVGTRRNSLGFRMARTHR